MRNKNNYRFCKVDTLSIREWIDKNIAVSIQTASRVENGIEKSLIKKYTPILNWTHNPNKFEPLKLLRKECRMIALKN